MKLQDKRHTLTVSNRSQRITMIDSVSIDTNCKLSLQNQETPPVKGTALVAGMLEPKKTYTDRNTPLNQALKR